jgi:hypothetical protein
MTYENIENTFNSLIQTCQSLIKRQEAVESVISNSITIEMNLIGRLHASEALINVLIRILSERSKENIDDLETNFNDVTDLMLALGEVTEGAIDSFNRSVSLSKQRFALLRSTID